MKKCLLSAFLTVSLFAFSGSHAIAAPSSLIQEAQKKPVVKITESSDELESGEYDEITISSSTSGFATITLDSADGLSSIVIADNDEIRSNSNTFSYYAVADDNKPINDGSYTFNVTVINQFGISSDPVKSKPISITPSTAEEFLVVEEPSPTPEPFVSNQQNAANTSQTANSLNNLDPATDIPNSQSGNNDSLEVQGTEQTAIQTSTEPFIATQALVNPFTPPQLSSDQTQSLSSTSSMLPVSSDNSLQLPQLQRPSVNYTTSSDLKIGEEGVTIGVGVSDLYPNSEQNYWSLAGAMSDNEIWAAIIRPITVVDDIDEKESVYVYANPSSKNPDRLGTVSGRSQGLNVLINRSDGWSLVEAYRNEDGAFMRGYIRTKRLKKIDVSTTYGIVIDKASQTLYVYMNGQKVGSCAVCTGLPTLEHLNYETPAGEFITVTRRGTIEYPGKAFSKNAIRINNTIHLQEIPTTKKGGSDYSILENTLGNKATRGTICVQNKASSVGGINAQWIWDMTENNKKVKVLIFDDKPRSSIPTK